MEEDKWPEWDKAAANYKEFILESLTMALEIVEGKWLRRRDWEVYIMARQQLALSIDLMKAMEVEDKKMDNQQQQEQPPTIQEDLSFVELDVTDEEMLEWINQNIDIASEYLAMALDLQADKYGRTQRARLARVIATDAWKVHMNIMGLEELWFREEESRE